MRSLGGSVVACLVAVLGCAGEESGTYVTSGPRGAADDRDATVSDRPQPMGGGGAEPDGDAGTGNSTITGTPIVADAGTSPTNEPNGVFTFGSGEVYLAGTLSEGACYLDAIALVEAPNRGAVGFDCYFDERIAVIDPTRSVLLYMNVFEDVLREFHCDDPCVWDEMDEMDGMYPSEPLRNDTILPTPPCDPETNRLTNFLVGPDGSRIHRCLTDGTWYDVDGNIRYEGSLSLLYLGANDYAFAGTHVVDLATGDEIPIVGLPTTDLLTTRASQDGFLVAFTGPTFDDMPELWEVATDGSAAMVGVYPLQPAGQSTRFGAALDGSGALYQMSSTIDVVFEDTIIRRTVDGDSEVVYSEADLPVVKIHISDLVTDP